MELREIVGLLCLLLAFAAAATGIWAAWYYAPARVYARQLAREQRERRRQRERRLQPEQRKRRQKPERHELRKAGAGT